MKITITEPAALRGTWVREDKPPPEREGFTIKNATLTNASGSYQPFSGHKLAVQTAEGWQLHDLRDHRFSTLHQRNMDGAVNDHFCWLPLSRSLAYAYVDLNAIVTVIDNRTRVHTLPPGQPRMGTSGGRIDPHVTIYNQAENRTSHVVRFRHDQLLNTWEVPAWMGVLHQCQQLTDGYLFCPGAQQDQSWYVDYDGGNLQRLETAEGSPPVQSWSHPCVAGNTIVYACVSGENAGWVMRRVRRQGHIWNPTRLFYATETQGLCKTPDWTWYQHGHLVEDKLLYSALRAKQSGDQAESHVLMFDLGTSEHHHLAGPIYHRPQWGSWVNPCLHPDHTWYAYQNDDDVVVKPLQ